MVLFTAAVLLGSQTDGRRRAWTTRDSHESRDVAGLVGVAGCAPAPPEVGVAGFEPTAPRSQSGCATKLRHTPWRPESRRTMAPRSGDLRARRTFGRPLWPDGAGSVLAEASDERALSEARDPFDAAGGGGAPSGWRRATRPRRSTGKASCSSARRPSSWGPRRSRWPRPGRAYQRFLGCSSVQASTSQQPDFGTLRATSHQPLRACATRRIGQALRSTWTATRGS